SDSPAQQGHSRSTPRSPTQAHRWIRAKEALFAISKAILGFANRTVNDAYMASEGTAYLIVGAEHDGGLLGVTPIDSALLGQKLRTYIGGAVRGTPTFVEIDGKSVLVVTVDAPRPGDSMHTLHKDYDKFPAGTIFVRHAGRTERAGPEEIRLLEERLLAGRQTPEIADIVVRPRDPKPFVIFDDSAEKIAEWVEARRAAIEQTVPAPTALQIAMNGGSGVGETKRQEFDSQVDKYQTDVARILPFAARHALVKTPYNKLRLIVHNTSDHPLRSALMRLSFPSALVEVFDAGIGGEHSLPKRPRFQEIDFAARYPDQLEKFGGLPNLHFHLSNEGGRVVVEWKVGDLQADQLLTSPALTVLPLSLKPATLAVEWSLSSMDRRGRQTGTFDLAVDQKHYVPLSIAGDPDAV
ncbi:helix-turn-helix domain-containing protein, partial [Rhodococcus qingshengii]